MNRNLLALSFFLSATMGLLAQSLESPVPPKPARHTLMLRMGGSAPGAGLAYDFLVLSKPKIGMAIYGGVAPINTGVYRYSPFMETIGAAFLYGSKRWKGEIDVEATHYYEKGIVNREVRPYSFDYTISNFYGAALIGVRRQSPWGGLFLKANVGPIVWVQRGSLRANPSASLAIGYTFGKTEWQRSMLLDKPGWRTRLALVAGVDRHFEHATDGRVPRPYVTPDFGSGPAARLGAMLDVAGQQSPWGSESACLPWRPGSTTNMKSIKPTSRSRQLRYSKANWRVSAAISTCVHATRSGRIARGSSKRVGMHLSMRQGLRGNGVPSSPIGVIGPITFRLVQGLWWRYPSNLQRVAGAWSHLWRGECLWLMM